jgi:hypothetical protein
MDATDGPWDNEDRVMAGELGDIGGFFREGGAINLDWLDVDEEEYRKLDRLPKQNLDIVPDLEAQWRHDDTPASRLVPNTGGPKTMVDLGPSGPVREVPEDLVRAARLIMVRTHDARAIYAALTSRFDADTLKRSASVLRPVLAERGLLGGLYVYASDFPDCANSNTKKSSVFVRKYAPGAKFVIAKKSCVECVHRQTLPDRTSRCGVFHKQVLVKVPYSDELAESVEKSQEAKGVTASEKSSDPKRRIQLAILGQSRNASTFTGRLQPKPKKPLDKVASGQILAASAQLAKEKETSAAKSLASAKARPIISLLRREMIKGRGEAELVHSLKLAFGKEDLQALRHQWEPVYREAGLYGAVYITQGSFSDCRVGAEFLSKHRSKVRAVVAGDKCSGCIFAKVGRCLMYGRKLVARKEDILTTETVAAVIDEHKMAGHLPASVVADGHQKWGSSPAEQLKAIHRVATNIQPTAMAPGFRGAVERGFYGGPGEQMTSDLTKRDIVFAAKRYMNEGLYGSQLATVLKGRFETRDLAAAKEELAEALAEQGLQGIKYVDPSVYPDYGHGCATASRLLRPRAAVKFAKVGSACASCVHQSMPGVCSVLNKQLVEEPPYVDKAAEQKAVLESGKSTEVRFDQLTHNGLSMMEEYELQRSASAAYTIDLNAPGEALDVDIEFGNQEIKL